MSKIKICIAGKNNIAVDVLQYIMQNKLFDRNEIVVVCNQTDTGKNTWQKSLRFFAKQYGIREVILEEVYEMEDVLFLSLEYDRIIKPKLFKTKQLYNVHFSALPKYKGMYTSVMPILYHEKESGVTFHRIDEGIDTGEIIKQVVFKIDKNDTARDLYFKYLYYGTSLVISQLCALRECKNSLEPNIQSCEESSYFSKKAINFSDIKIDVKKTAYDICAQLRAFTFREYQLAQINGQSVIKAEITGIRSYERPGTVIYQDDWRCVMATIDYDIVIFWDRFNYVMKAAVVGDVNALQKIPHLEYYVNQSDEHGRSPLIVSAYHGNYDAFMLMVYNGADLQKKDWNGTTLLMYAKDGWKKNKDERIFKYLRHKGLPLDSVDYNGKSLKEYCTNKEWEILTSL